MNIEFVTSFGESYFDKIAQYTLPLMVKATKEHYLKVYYENNITLTPKISYESTNYRNLYHCSPELLKFLLEIKSDESKKGKEFLPIHEGIWLDDQKKSGYNYKLNAFAFCRKWYAMQHAFKKAMRHHENFYLIWLDADIMMIDYMQNLEQEIKNLFINGASIAYLARNYIHSECGFMIFKSGSASMDLINGVCDAYSTHDVFKLPEWHDSFVFDEIRKSMDSNHFVKMCEGELGEDVFSKCFLADYATHLKGNLKYRAKELIENEQVIEPVK